MIPSHLPSRYPLRLTGLVSVRNACFSLSSLLTVRTASRIVITLSSVAITDRA